MSVAFLLGGLRLGVGSLDAVGPGFFPVVAAVIGLAAAGLTVTEAAARMGDANSRTQLPDRAGMRRMAGYLGALLVFAVLLERAGFLPAAVLTCTVTSLVSGQSRAWRAAAFGVGISVAVYLVFTELLGVPLPRIASVR